MATYPDFLLLPVSVFLGLCLLLVFDLLLFAGFALLIDFDSLIAIVPTSTWRLLAEARASSDPASCYASTTNCSQVSIYELYGRTNGWYTQTAPLYMLHIVLTLQQFRKLPREKDVKILLLLSTKSGNVFWKSERKKRLALVIVR